MKLLEAKMREEVRDLIRWGIVSHCLKESSYVFHANSLPQEMKKTRPDLLSEEPPDWMAIKGKCPNKQCAVHCYLVNIGFLLETGERKNVSNF